ncbi:hypothetical protein BH24ACT20_BH24ACT20_17770 [soil metagenome]
MDRERLEALSMAELEDLRAEIELLLVQRRVAEGKEPGGGGGIQPGNLGSSGREVVEERQSEHGILRREVDTGPEASDREPRWYLYYYAHTKTGKRRLISENLGTELPAEYRD